MDKTEHLLIRVANDWRQALDNGLAVGVVFVDFWKSFETVFHSLSGDLWSWIKGYLTNHSQVTVVNGYKSERMFMKYGVLQGSVLGPTLFSLSCNDFPDIAECEGILQMYVDNTATYTTAPLLDKVTEKLNAILEKLYEWCCRNQLSAPPPPLSAGDPMSSIVVCLYSSSLRYGSRLSCFALVSRFFSVASAFA